MKKISAVMFCILIMLASFAPLCHAEEPDKIEYINISYELQLGEPVIDTEIKISASKTSLPEEIVDMTDSFEIDEVIWCKVVAEPVEGLDESAYYEYKEGSSDYYLICTKDDVVDETTTYKLILNDIKSKEGIVFNFIGLDRIMINSTSFDMIGGDAQSDGSNLFLSFLTTNSGPVIKEIVTQPAVTETIPETVIETTTAITEDDGEDAEKEKCSLCGICPFQPQGVCLFIWIGVIVAGIVVILILVKSLLKKDDED